jgi:molybdate transport system ATP-binding protein
VRGPGPVRLLVQARDVSLALAAAEGSSILNLVPVVVDEIWEDGKARVMVRLQAADQVLLAAVTRRSLTALELVPGKRVHAQIKSVALL